MGSYWIRVGSKFSDSVLIRKRTQTGTQRRGCKDGGRAQSGASTSLGAPRTAEKRGVRLELGSPSESPEGVNPANTRFQTSGLLNGERINVCCFKPFIL